jgi:Tol biopolymer transport system component
MSVGANRMRFLAALVVVGAVTTLSSGSGARAGAHPASPPGAEVVFVSFGVVTVADASRTGVSRVPLPGDVLDAWPSPDGSLVVYEESGAKSGYRLAVADLGSGRERWASSAWSFDPPVWAPSGDRFAFASPSGQLWVGGSTRKDLRLVTDDYTYTGFAWSPDGRRLAFGSRLGLAVFDLRSRRSTVLVPGTSTADPAWSSDGTRIAYVGDGKLSLVAATGSARPRSLARGVNRVEWSPDGLQLAYLTPVGLFLVGVAEGSRARLVRRNVLDFDWSPDSRLLAFSSPAPLHPSIFTVGRRGEAPHRLTFPASPNNDRSPLWSPDGKHIAFERSARGIPRLYVADPDGSHAGPILQDDFASEPSPSGRTVTWLKTRLRLRSPPPLVPVRPATEISSGSSVVDLAVDGDRAAALVNYEFAGGGAAWESKLWSPIDAEQAGADVRCDGPTAGNWTADDVTGPVIAGDRYAYLCREDFGDTRLYAATTEQPQAGSALLDEPDGVNVSAAGRGALLVATINGDLVRLDPGGGMTELTHFPQNIDALEVDQDRVLVQLGRSSLQIVASDGATSVSLPLPHRGGAVLRGSRLVTLDDGTLAVHDLNGQVLLQRTLPHDAGLEDVAGDLVLYTVRGRLHLLRLSDSRDVALGLSGQVTAAIGGFTADGGIVVGYSRATERPGTLAYVSPEGVDAALAAGD